MLKKFRRKAVLTIMSGSLMYHFYTVRLITPFDMNYKYIIQDE